MSFIIGIRNQIFRLFYRLARPLIFLMDPENAHYTLKRVGVFLGSNPVTRGLTTLLFDYGHKSLNIKVDGIEYRNPVGLSAGFDKDGELTSIYPSLGFGLAELGSFTGEVCPGNPGKRLFRMVKSRSIVVWYGLNNFGANDCLIIKPTDESIDNKERLIPYIKETFIKSVDKKKKLVNVNWKSDY